MSTPVEDDSIIGSELVKEHGGGVPEDLESGMDELEEGGYPRLRINHKEGRFIESVSDTEYETLEGVVILGFSYSRVMWKPTKPGIGFKSDELPQCRSNDNKHGQPNTDVEKPVLFPWNTSVFDPTKAQVNPLFNRVLLDCEKCSFQVWGSDGSRPACGLAMNVYVMYQPPGAENPVMAFLTIKGAGLRPMKKFFKKVRGSGENAAPYQFTVSLNLDVQTSGDVEFCTPRVSVTGVIPKEYWAGLSEQYSIMRDFTKNIVIEADDKEIAVNGYTPPRSEDPNFFMSTDELKEGIDPAVMGGGRRSAPPPRRVKEIASGGTHNPLGSIMGGHTQTIAGTVVQTTPKPAPQPAQPVQQAPAPQAPPPVQPQQTVAAPVQTGQPSGTPVATAPAPTPPPQSAPAPRPASSGMNVPLMGGMRPPQQMPTAVQVAEPMPVAGEAVSQPPWASEVPSAPYDFAEPGKDTYEEPSSDDDVEGSYPWT